MTFSLCAVVQDKKEIGVPPLYVTFLSPARVRAHIKTANFNLHTCTGFSFPSVAGDYLCRLVETRNLHRALEPAQQPKPLLLQSIICAGWYYYQCFCLLKN